MQSGNVQTKKDQAIRLEQALYIQRNMPIGAVAAALGAWLIVFLYRDTPFLPPPCCTS
jgi:hypothetical protein